MLIQFWLRSCNVAATCRRMTAGVAMDAKLQLQMYWRGIPAHVLFMRCPDHFVCIHSTLTDLPCCFFCSNRTGYRGPRQCTAETAAETLLERNLPNLICSGGGNPLQNFIWHFWSRNWVTGGLIERRLGSPAICRCRLRSMLRRPRRPCPSLRQHHRPPITLCRRCLAQSA